MTRRIEIVGHRGALAAAPENTESAFRAAHEAGVDGVELDVRLTRDGRALAHHDEDTLRVCGRGGPVLELDLDDARRLRVRPGFFAPARARMLVPLGAPAAKRPRLLSLDEALSILRPDLAVQIEMKGTPDLAPRLPREVAAAVARTGGPRRVLVTSSVPELLEAVRAIAPEIGLGLVVRRRPAFDVARTVAALRPEALVPNRRHVDEAFVRRHASRPVWPYTVNTEREVARLARAGVAGVITDVPARARAWIDERTPSVAPPPRLLAVDLGSTTIDVAALDERGHLHASASAPCPMVHGPDGAIGVDAAELVRIVDRLAGDVLASAPSVEGLAVATQRSTFVLFDAETAEPIGDAPSWRCARGRRLVAARRDRADFVRRRTGLRLASSFGASKIAWKLRRAPRDRPLAVLPLSGYLLYRASDGALRRTDPTLAARTLLHRFDRDAWDDDLLELFGVPRAVLPEIGDTAGDLGTVRLGGRDLAVRVEVGDQQAALAGLGDSGDPAPRLNLGTGAFVLLPCEEPRRARGLLASIAWRARGRTRYLLEGSVHGVASSLDAVVRDPALDRLGRAELLARARGDTLVLPAREGLGSPYFDPRSRVVVRGPRDAPSVARGTVEGIGHLVHENLAAIERVAPPFDALACGGGLTHDPHVMQVLADTLGRPLRVAAARDATLAGLARLAFPDGGRGASPLAVFEPRASTREARRRHLAWRRAVGPVARRARD